MSVSIITNPARIFYSFNLKFTLALLQSAKHIRQDIMVIVIVHTFVEFLEAKSFNLLSTTMVSFLICFLLLNVLEMKA